MPRLVSSTRVHDAPSLSILLIAKNACVSRRSAASSELGPSQDTVPETRSV